MWIIPPLLKSFLPEVLQSLSRSWFSSYLSRCSCIVFFQCFSPAYYQPSLGHCPSPSRHSSLCPSVALSCCTLQWSLLCWQLTEPFPQHYSLSPFSGSSCSNFSFMSHHHLPHREFNVSSQVGSQSSPFLYAAMGVATTLLRVPEADWLTVMCILCPLHPTQQHRQA